MLGPSLRMRKKLEYPPGIVNGQNPSIFNGVAALFRIGKMVSGLLFLYCS